MKYLEKIGGTQSVRRSELQGICFFGVTTKAEIINFSIIFSSMLHFKMSQHKLDLFTSIYNCV